MGSLAVSAALILIAASREAAVVVAVRSAIGGSIVLASATTLFQRLAPAEAEGTLRPIYSLLVTGTTPLGSLLVGALAEAAGIRVTTALLGVGCLLAVANRRHGRLPASPARRRGGPRPGRVVKTRRRPAFGGSVLNAVRSAALYRSAAHACACVVLGGVLCVLLPRRRLPRAWVPPTTQRRIMSPVRFACSMVAP